MLLRQERQFRSAPSLRDPSPAVPALGTLQSWGLAGAAGQQQVPHVTAHRAWVMARASRYLSFQVLGCLPMLLISAWCCCDVLWLTEQPCAALLSMSWLHFYLSALIRCFLAQAHVFSRGKMHFFLVTKAKLEINHLSTARLTEVERK